MPWKTPSPIPLLRREPCSSRSRRSSAPVMRRNSGPRSGHGRRHSGRSTRSRDSSTPALTRAGARRCSAASWEWRIASRRRYWSGCGCATPATRCRELWPQFVATDWLSTVAATEGDRVEDDRQRSVLLQIWWFTGKGAATERHAAGRRYLAVPDGAKFRAAAQELLTLLKEL